MNKKPISKIIKLEKIKEFAISDSQAQDPNFDLDLGDTVSIVVVGKVVRSADAGENLFAFSREFAVEPKGAFVNSVQKWEKDEDTDEEEEIESDVDDLKKAGVKSAASLNAFRISRRQKKEKVN